MADRTAEQVKADRRTALTKWKEERLAKMQQSESKSSGPFDPKAIINKKKATQESKVLGGDMVIPKTTAASAAKRNVFTAPSTTKAHPISAGLSLTKKRNAEGQQVAHKVVNVLGGDEDEDTPKPTTLPVFDDEIDTNVLNDDDGEADDKVTTDVKKSSTNDEEEIDPLDAYMATLDTDAKPKSSGIQSKGIMTFDDGDDFMPEEDAGMDSLLQGPAKRSKKAAKDVSPADPSKFVEFRKNFYIVPQSIRALKDHQVKALRDELDKISVGGKDVPCPIVKWAHFGLSSKSLDIIERLGFTTPTPIQAQAIPAIMSGRDLIGIAKTGSGKTLAYLMPMFRHVLDQPDVRDREGPIGLVMAPTRELAVQIHKECKVWTKVLGIRSVCMYGGAPIADQIREMKSSPQIVVATCGRWIDMLVTNSGRLTNLNRMTYLVVDEADRMFDMGFEPQMNKIISNTRPDRQTVLFSATFPAKMETLARKILNNPVTVTVGGRSVVAKEIEQLVEVVDDEKSKFNRLLKLLGDHIAQDDDARALVFVERQESAERLHNEVFQRGYVTESIHGGKDQLDRDSIIRDFKSGVFQVIVATSVAARGLDVKECKLVVNYDCPNHLEDYVHRCGRTGRAGRKGFAATFILPEQTRFAAAIARALKDSDKEVPAKVKEMAETWEAGVKEGKNRQWSGFGGRGVDNYTQKFEAGRKVERKAHIGEEGAADAESDKEEASGGAFASKPKPAAEPAEKPTDGSDIRIFRADAPADQVKAEMANARGSIESRLRVPGEVRNTAPIDNRGPDAGAFHAIFEVNDLPQKARWSVTNRTNVAKVLDSTGASITNKGQYYDPNGEGPKEGEPPKLFLLIEGDTENQVRGAYMELNRLVDNAKTDAGPDRGARGRYSVV